MGRTASTEPRCLYSTAIPLLHLWSIRPLQTLGECTVQLYIYSTYMTVRPVEYLSACTVQLYLFSPYGLYSLYRASVLVEYSYISIPAVGRPGSTEPQCLYSTDIPLLPLWAVQSLQCLRACTVQLYLFSPIGRTASTEPQCLYSTAIPLLPLWAERPLKNISACTVQLYLYSPLWAVRPVQTLRACTVHLYLYSPYGPYGL